MKQKIRDYIHISSQMNRYYPSVCLCDTIYSIVIYESSSTTWMTLKFSHIHKMCLLQLISRFSFATNHKVKMQNTFFCSKHHITRNKIILGQRFQIAFDSIKQKIDKNRRKKNVWNEKLNWTLYTFFLLFFKQPPLQWCHANRILCCCFLWSHPIWVLFYFLTEYQISYWIISTWFLMTKEARPLDTFNFYVHDFIIIVCNMHEKYLMTYIWMKLFTTELLQYQLLLNVIDQIFFSKSWKKSRAVRFLVTLISAMPMYLCTFLKISFEIE